MTFAEYVIRKKVTVIMGTLGMILLGVIALHQIPQELFPRVGFPQITIVTEYSNAAPEEIENLITKPIEESIGSVSGLKRVESISREGRSSIVVSFNWGQDIDFAALAVREKIDLVKERLPKEAEDPVVLKFDPLSRPILILSVTGNLEPIRLKMLTEKMLKDNLEKVEGVASVGLSGGANREIQVNVDQARLQASHLSLLQLIQSIEDTNVSYPAGSIKKGLYEYLIRTVGEFRSVKEIDYSVAGVDTVQKIKKEDTSFLERNNDEGARDTLDTLRQEVKRQMLEKRLVLVKDIAEVVDGVAEKTSISRHNGKENLSLSIQKQGNANTIQLVNKLRQALKALDPDLKSRGIKYDIIYDHSEFIRKSIDDLKSAALQGGFLAFLVLLFFLRSWFASLLVTLSIPLTILGTFFCMQMTGISLNTMSLMGLAVAIGMIVDTSIVVVENIFRRRQLGESAEEAAIKGSAEMTWAVIGSNLTTIAVFFPLILFVPGVMGQMLKDLSWAIIFSQIISTVVPLTTVAMLTTYFKFQFKDYEPSRWPKIFEKYLDPRLPRISHESFLGSSLLLILVVIVGVTMLLFPTLDREVLPKVDQGQFLIKVDMPIGTRLEITDRVVKRMEGLCKETQNVKDVAVTIGAEKSKQGDVKVETLRPWQAIVLATLQKERKRSSAAVVDEIRDKLGTLQLEEARVEFILQESEFQFGNSQKPILIEVKGYDFLQMNRLVNTLKKQLQQVDGIVDLEDDVAEPAQETKLEIGKQRAALYGISPMDISLTAKAAIEGVVATKYHEEGKEYDIRVRLSSKDRDNIQNLNDLLLYSQVMDQLLPLKEVAVIKKGLGPSEIRHVNQERTTIISASLRKDIRTKDAIAQVQKILKNIQAGDFQVNIAGAVKEQAENYGLLFFAFAVALILNYMIMAALFESFMQPMIIMFAVPLSFVGVVVSLWITGVSINVMSMFAVIQLVGTVVNNAIVLMEYINQLRAEGVGVVEAAITSIKVRTRPIIMSALTAAIGLLPLTLGLGEGSELQRPMAIATMGGTLSSTGLTLIVIPFLYILTTYFMERFIPSEEDEDEDEGEDKVKL
ncbi:MAG: efflux RND transporter permease subunit [Candidatus Omnitrophica bacterium]|nr:efflux RND transporter permease subunit [Candidatus Omnitrophota bacterium]